MRHSFPALHARPSGPGVQDWRAFRGGAVTCQHGVVQAVFAREHPGAIDFHASVSTRADQPPTRPPTPGAVAFG